MRDIWNDGRQVLLPACAVPGPTLSDNLTLQARRGLGMQMSATGVNRPGGGMSGTGDSGGPFLRIDDPPGADKIFSARDSRLITCR